MIFHPSRGVTPLEVLNVLTVGSLDMSSWQNSQFLERNPKLRSKHVNYWSQEGQTTGLIIVGQ